ncbi:MAG: hypothetical protein IJD04_01320 [Desulfovibrionaceae bacterium]|nr:hypothetical protein [Desulfovibrionaceae bacterium]
MQPAEIAPAPAVRRSERIFPIKQLQNHNAGIRLFQAENQPPEKILAYRAQKT